MPILKRYTGDADLDNILRAIYKDLGNREVAVAAGTALPNSPELEVIKRQVASLRSRVNAIPVAVSTATNVPIDLSAIEARLNYLYRVDSKGELSTTTIKRNGAIAFVLVKDMANLAISIYTATTLGYKKTRVLYVDNVSQLETLNQKIISNHAETDQRLSQGRLYIGYPVLRKLYSYNYRTSPITLISEITYDDNEAYQTAYNLGVA